MYPLNLVQASELGSSGIQRLALQVLAITRLTLFDFARLTLVNFTAKIAVSDARVSYTDGVRVRERGQTDGN